jgi:hypothetical protein
MTIISLKNINLMNSKHFLYFSNILNLFFVTFFIYNRYK